LEENVSGLEQSVSVLKDENGKLEQIVSVLKDDNSTFQLRVTVIATKLLRRRAKCLCPKGWE